MWEKKFQPTDFPKWELALHEDYEIWMKNLILSQSYDYNVTS